MILVGVTGVSKSWQVLSCTLVSQATMPGGVPLFDIVKDIAPPMAIRSL